MSADIVIFTLFCRRTNCRLTADNDGACDEALIDFGYEPETVVVVKLSFFMALVVINYQYFSFSIIY